MLQFAVVDHWNNRGAHDANRNLGLTQGANNLEPRGRGRCPGLQGTFQLIVQCGQADPDLDQATGRQLAQQVEVTQDKRTLGDDRSRMPIPE